MSSLRIGLFIVIIATIYLYQKNKLKITNGLFFNTLKIEVNLNKDMEYFDIEDFYSSDSIKLKNTCDQNGLYEIFKNHENIEGGEGEEHIKNIKSDFIKEDFNNCHILQSFELLLNKDNYHLKCDYTLFSSVDKPKYENIYTFNIIDQEEDYLYITIPLTFDNNGSAYIRIIIDKMGGTHFILLNSLRANLITNTQYQKYMGFLQLFNPDSKKIIEAIKNRENKDIKISNLLVSSKNRDKNITEFEVNDFGYFSNKYLSVKY